MCLAALLPTACATTGVPNPERPVPAVLTLRDPRGDDHGPGGYTYPQGQPYAAGAFDLTSVRLAEERAWLEIEVTFARPIPMATVRLTADQVATLPVLAFDLYLDLDGVRGQGRREALPGRQVRLADGRGWEVAIVLHPTPAAVEGLYERATGSASVWVPRRVRIRGRSLRARVPADVLGGHALGDVGIAAAVSGVVFGASFRGAVDGATPTAFVREVTAEPGQCGRWEEAPDGAPCTFGGCRGCGLHPRVMDALAPRRGEQERALARYDTARGVEGELPVVGPPVRLAAGPPGDEGSPPGDGEAAAPESRPAVAGLPPSPSLRGEVRGRDGALVTAWFPRDEPRPGAIGQALGADGGACGAVVVIERLSERLLLLKAPQPLLCAPARVRFPTVR